MKRGEVWTFRDEGYASKARPVVIVQSNEINDFDSIILCLFTTYESSDISTRVLIAATDSNGLSKDSFVMTEKIVTVAKSEMGKQIGALTDVEMRSITDNLARVLGITEGQPK